MKNLATKSLFIICIALAVLLFKECESNKDSGQEFEEPKGLTTRSNGANYEENYKDNQYKQEFEEPKGLITEEQANNYEENYKDNQYKFINEILNNNGVAYKDSRAIRFELEEIENYIHYVKKEAKKRELDGELSLRIYFGAKNSKFEKENDNVMRSTLFLVPTHREITRNTELKHENINGISPLNMGNAGDPDNIEYGGN